MEPKNNRGLIIAVCVLLVLVIGLSGYLVYDKFLKEDQTINNDENYNKDNQSHTKTNYQLSIDEICPSRVNCTKNIDNIVLGDNTYNASIQIYDDSGESWDEGKHDSLILNNKTITTEYSFIRYIAIMNDEFLIVATNGIAPADVYSIMVFDKNLNEIETFGSYNQDINVSNNLNRDVIDNNTTLLIYDCTVDDNASYNEEGRHINQILTTYSVKFHNGTFNKTQTNILNDTFCTAEVA